MSDQWRNERRGDFGWSVEGAGEIKAFWLPEVVFADPAERHRGKIAQATQSVLQRKLAEYADEIMRGANFASAMRSGKLEAVAVSDKLGGGYLIVFQSGIFNFQTLAIEGTSLAPVGMAETTDGAGTYAVPGTAKTSSAAFVGWLSRALSFRRTAKLALRLASDDEATFLPALSEAVRHSTEGSDVGIRAMEEAMRRRAGRRDLLFFQPLGTLTVRTFGELEDSARQLIQLAKQGALLRDPAFSQNLMSACRKGHGAEGIRECILRAAEVGGVNQCWTFQLLYNHLVLSAKLLHARGAQSFTEQMSDEIPPGPGFRKHE